MKRKPIVLVIRDEDVKIRKVQAPPVKVVQSKKVYDRKREKRRFPEGEPPLFTC